MDPLEKTEGSLKRDGSSKNTYYISIDDPYEKWTYNITKSGKSEIVSKAFKDAKRKEWNVKFEIGKYGPILSTLEIIPDELQSRDTILKKVSELRLSGEKFSSLTDLSNSLSICSSSSSTKISTKIPSNAKKVEIKDILERANEGVDKEKLEEIKKLREKSQLKCVCCGKSEHSEADPMDFNTWYYLNETSKTNGNLSERAIFRFKELQVVLNERPFCECDLKAIPRSPCNIFRRISTEEKKRIDNAYEGKYASELRSIDEGFDKMEKQTVFLKKESKEEIKEIAESMSSIETSDKKPTVRFEVLGSITDKQRINHIVPRSAGGCPTKTFDIVKEFKGEKVPASNLIPIWNMCPLCQLLDELFTKWQGEQSYDSVELFIEKVINKKF